MMAESGFKRQNRNPLQPAIRDARAKTTQGVARCSAPCVACCVLRVACDAAGTRDERGARQGQRAASGKHEAMHAQSSARGNLALPLYSRREALG